MELKPGQVFLLRWRYDFVGKSAVFGMWNSSHISAWDRNGPGLVRASIEVKDLATSKTFTRVECDGHDFRTFQWLTIARITPNFKGSISPRPEHVGLQLLSTNYKYTVLINGQVVKEDLLESERTLNFATYGR